MCWTIILTNSNREKLNVPDAEVLSRQEMCFVRVKWEATILQFRNLEMGKIEWLLEYIKLITLYIPIRIASSWATEILDKALLKRF